MSKPYKCPVCKGQGRVIIKGEGKSTISVYKPCVGCAGSGVVWISASTVAPFINDSFSLSLQIHRPQGVELVGS